MIFKICVTYILFLQVQSHLSIIPSTIPIGSETSEFQFRFSHACNATDSTVKFRIYDIPSIMGSIKPAYQSGWDITTSKSMVIKPDGKSVSQIVNITWDGQIVSDSLAGVFSVFMKPPVSGSFETIYFRAIQWCASGEQEQWIETPSGNTLYTDLKFPAPLLNITTSSVNNPSTSTGGENIGTILGAIGLAVGCFSIILSAILFLKINSLK